MNSLSTQRNITPRRSKALPVVEHPRFWKCILISKEANHGRWSLFGGWNNSRKDREWRIISQERSEKAVVRELREELWDNISVERLEDLWTIFTNKSWRLVSHREKKRIKQRIFAVLANGKVDKDDIEIESVWFYPLEEKYSDLRKSLRSNMDDFAKKALIDFRRKLLSSWYMPWNVQVSKTDTRAYDDFIKGLWYNRSVISRILNW